MENRMNPAQPERARPLGSTGWFKAVIWSLVLSIAILDIWASVNMLTHIGHGKAGSCGFSVGAAGEGNTYPIVALESTSPLAASGAQVGDQLHFDRAGFTKRIPFEPGEMVGLTLIQHGSAKHLFAACPAVAALPAPALYVIAELVVISLFSLGLAALIALRRPDSRSALLLALILISTSGELLQSGLPGGTAQSLSYLFFKPFTFALNYIGVIYFSLLFPHDSPQRVPRRLRIAGRLFLALFTADSITSVLSRVGGHFVPNYVVGHAGRTLATSASLFAIAGLFYSYRRAEGDARQRLLWVGASLGLIFTTYIAVNTGLSEVMGDVGFNFFQTAFILAGFLGLTYACLRLHVFDFGFAVNRALVYGVVSVGLLVSFGVLEWAVHHLVDFEERQQNAFVDAGVALGLYLAFHKARHTVEHFIERLFFRKWHLRDAALRRFVARAAHITKASALHDAFGQALQQFCEGASWALYRLQDDGSYRRVAGDMTGMPSVVDANEPAVVTLRAAPHAAARREDGSALPADLALPMAHRGQLDGFVLVGKRPGKADYRPDEVAQLENAAHQIGLDLHALAAADLKLALAASQNRVHSLEASLDLLRPLAHSTSLDT
jgi:hypothetical protein